MSETPTFTDVLPASLPAAAALIAELRATDDPDERAAIVARYPVLELAAPVPVFAEWLGMRLQSIYAARTAKRKDGALVWPDEDGTMHGLKVWRFSTIALHRASAPGRGWNLRGEIRAGAK